MSVTIRPFTWNELSAIEEAAVLDSTDEQCLVELREVLEKHDRIDKFGVALLHQHFPVERGEVLVERADAATRTLLTTPVAAEEAAKMDLVPTIWRFDSHAGWGCSYCKKNHHN